MSIHILFADGSNPYIRYNMTPAEFAQEILKWSKNFDLTFIKVSGETIFNFEAKEKKYGQWLRDRAKQHEKERMQNNG